MNLNQPCISVNFISAGAKLIWGPKRELRTHDKCKTMQFAKMDFYLFNMYK